MTAAEQLYLGKLSPRHNKNLDQFVVEPGETLEQSLTRAVNWHIHDHSFSEISRTVSIKRLEVAIAQMQSELEDDALRLMYELLGLAQAQQESFVGRLVTGCVRTSLRQKLSKLLTRAQFLTVCAYEFHLASGALPIAEADPEVPELKILAVH